MYFATSLDVHEKYCARASTASGYGLETWSSTVSPSEAWVPASGLVSMTSLWGFSDLTKLTWAVRPAFSTAALASSTFFPTTEGTTYGVATERVISSVDLNSVPSAGSTETTVPASASELTGWMWMFTAPAARSACWASSIDWPVTCGIVRATATVMVAPPLVSARLPGSGSHARTVPMPSSAADSTTVTLNPAASRRSVAVCWSSPMTSGTVCPPQYSCS